jgi:hypothetical protein
MKTIAVDIDDTLNNFSETLQRADFPHHERYALTPEVFQTYLDQLRSAPDEKGDLLSTEFTYFRYKIHHECYTLATARADGVEFMKWLRRDKWRIVICTSRDLRRANEATRKWLHENEIPFDYLFLALNKLEFCKAWGIELLLDDHIFSVMYADHYRQNVYYPVLPKHEKLESGYAKGFTAFEEVKEWMTR